MTQSLVSFLGRFQQAFAFLSAPALFSPLTWGCMWHSLIPSVTVNQGCVDLLTHTHKYSVGHTLPGEECPSNAQSWRRIHCRRYGCPGWAASWAVGGGVSYTPLGEDRETLFLSFFSLISLSFSSLPTLSPPLPAFSAALSTWHCLLVLMLTLWLGMYSCWVLPCEIL